MKPAVVRRLRNGIDSDAARGWLQHSGRAQICSTACKCSGRLAFYEDMSHRLVGSLAHQDRPTKRGIDPRRLRTAKRALTAALYASMTVVVGAPALAATSTLSAPNKGVASSAVEGSGCPTASRSSQIVGQPMREVDVPQPGLSVNCEYMPSYIKATAVEILKTGGPVSPISMVYAKEAKRTSIASVLAITKKNLSTYKCNGVPYTYSGTKFVCQFAGAPNVAVHAFEIYTRAVQSKATNAECAVWVDTSGFPVEIASTANTGHGSTYTGSTSKATMCGWAQHMALDS
jgi:hypothetical protein